MRIREILSSNRSSEKSDKITAIDSRCSCLTKNIDGITITGITYYWRQDMRVTTKGQVTIPQEIREKLNITPAVEIDFVEEKDRIYLVKRKDQTKRTRNFDQLRGIATVKMTTDEIMALTRGGK